MIEIHLPIIICGSPRYGEGIELHYNYIKPVKVVLPMPKENEIRAIKESSPLLDVTTSDIIYFLDQVGSLLLQKNYDIRREMIENIHLITGFSREKLEKDIDSIGRFLNTHYLRKTADIELGTLDVLDRWIKVGGVEIRAIPHGRILHILSGNIPEVAPLSLVRGLLTKNSNIVKIASRDPSTPVYFTLAMRDVDKNHPLNRAISVLYWKRDTQLEETLFKCVDGVCVWGRRPSLLHARSKTREGQFILEFGPKRSYCMVDKESVSNNKRLIEVAEGIAKDVVLHDQFACLSPLVIFVEGDAEKFCNALYRSLKEIGKKIPPKKILPDEAFVLSYVRNICRLAGDKIFYSKSPPYTVILTENFSHTLYHPLHRTVFVVKVNSLKDATSFIDENVMVVSFSSLKELNLLKNDLAKRKIERLTLVGQMSFPPLGLTSSHTYPMYHMVRFICRDLTEEEKKIRYLKIPSWVRL